MEGAAFLIEYSYQYLIHVQMIEIRELNSDELKKLLDLYADLHADETPATEEQAKGSWDALQDNAAIHTLGVFDGGELLSSCTLVIIPNLTRNCRPYGLIENVVTRKDQRHKGMGKKVLKYALDLAWDKNCYKVMLMTGRLDEETFRFYEKSGFDRDSKQAFIARRE